MYEVRLIMLDLKSPKNDEWGGDSEHHSEYKTRTKAFSVAKKLSKIRKHKSEIVHEVMVLKEDKNGNDPLGQWYFSKGKLKINMF